MPNFFARQCFFLIACQSFLRKQWAKKVIFSAQNADGRAFLSTLMFRPKKFAHLDDFKQIVNRFKKKFGIAAQWIDKLSTTKNCEKLENPNLISFKIMFTRWSQVKQEVSHGWTLGFVYVKVIRFFLKKAIEEQFYLLLVFNKKIIN